MNYEQGLTKIEDAIADTTRYTDIRLAVNRLRDNLKTEKYSDMTSVLYEAHLAIVERLELLTIRYFGVSFRDLCQETHGQVVVSPVPTAQTSSLTLKDSEVALTPTSKIRNKAFISYNRHDKKYLEYLHAHLKYDVRAGTIGFWDGTQIPPGAIWRQELEKALTSAKIAVLLVSADFLASDFIAEEELPHLLKAQAEEGTQIYCVILRPCVFKHTELYQFQAINPPSDPLSTMSQSDQEKVWVNLTDLIREKLQLKQ